MTVRKMYDPDDVHVSFGADICYTRIYPFRWYARAEALPKAYITMFSDPLPPRRRWLKDAVVR